MQSSNTTDEFNCYHIPTNFFVQWYDIEPTFGFSFSITASASRNENEQKETETSEGKKKIRSTSAYALFFREKQANEKRSAPYATFGQISQRIARQWDNLSENEKKAYKQKCEKNRKKSIANAVEEKARQLMMGVRGK